MRTREVAQSTFLTVGHPAEIELDHNFIGTGPKAALCEGVARFQQIICLERPERMETQPARALGERPLVVPRLIVPLPLRRQEGFIEFVAGLRHDNRGALHRLLPGPDKMAYSFVVRRSDDRPTVDPGDRKEAVTTTFPRAIAVVRKEIPVPFFGLNQASLIGFVKLLFRVAQLLVLCIRPGNGIGSFHHHDPALRPPVFTVKMIIDLVDLIELVRFAAA